MSEFIVKNLQTLLMGLAVLVGAVYASTGFYRRPDAEDNPILAYDGRRAKRGLAVAGVGVLLAAVVGFVPAGHRGVVFDAGQGVLQDERGEGLTLLIPFWQRLHNMDVRVKEYTYDSFAQSRDFQEVTLPVTLNIRIDPNAAASVYQNIGSLDMASDFIIEPAAFQAVTEAAGQFELVNIARSRAEIVQLIGNIVEPRLAQHGFILTNVAVRDALVGENFIAAVERERIAERDILTAQHQEEIAEIEGRADERRAAFERFAIEHLTQAERNRIDELGFTPAEYIRYLWIQAWDGQVPQTLVGLDDASLIFDVR